MPWPQKGDLISIPIGSQAQVLGGPLPVTVTGRGNALFNAASGGASLGNLYQVNAGTLSTGSGSTAVGNRWLETTSSGSVALTGVYADLSTATATSINALRTAFQLQRMLERDARGGTRYIESIWAHFGVVNPDFRLQRPEFIGSGSGMININPVASTYTAPGQAPRVTCLLLLLA